MWSRCCSVTAKARGWHLADDLAERLDGRVAVIYGGHGLAAVAANRWKCQINENGKAPPTGPCSPNWITTRSSGGRPSRSCRRTVSAS